MRMPTVRTGLWHHADFRTFWAGQTVSQFGSQITFLALPLTAAVVLQATPIEMGLLVAAETAPLLLSLFVGVWTDRRRRRPLLLAADWGRVVLLLLVPIALWLDMLTIPVLYVVAFLLGVLTVLFDVAYQSFLPTLVPRTALVEGNSKLEVSRSAAQIAGPGVAGSLVQLFTAPLTLVLDALSFVLSALCIHAIRTPEPPIVAPVQRSVWREIGEGLNVVLRHPVRRALVGCAATGNIAHAMVDAVLLVYLTRTLQMSPGLIGLIFASGNIGFLAGAVFAAPLIRKLTIGRTLIGAILLDGIGALCFPFASDTTTASLFLLVLGRFLVGCAGTIFTIQHVSLRQAITPDAVQGRMNASVRFLAGGVVPLGAVLGGTLGTAIGVRPTLLVAASGTALAVLWLWYSPVRVLNTLPVLDGSSAQSGRGKETT